MPTYQYACQDCGVQHEIVQSFTDDTLTVCPSCQGSLRKVFSSVGVVFKGSGFYRNDSRSNSSSTVGATPAKDSSASTGGDSGSASGSTDSGSSAATPAPAAAPAPSTPSTSSSASSS